MVGDEVDCCLIIEVPLFVLVGAGLVEGSDDAISTKGLVHVGLHGAMEGVADSVELVVDVEVRLHNMVAEEDQSECEDQNPAGELEQQAEDEDQVCDLAEDSSETVEDGSIEDVDII